MRNKINPKREISVEDFKDYISETILASSTSDRKKLVAVFTPARTPEYFFRLEYVTNGVIETMDLNTSFAYAITRYNEV